MKHICIVEQSKAFHFHTGTTMFCADLFVTVYIWLCVKYITGMYFYKLYSNVIALCSL